jgi:hypothetical protein
MGSLLTFDTKTRDTPLSQSLPSRAFLVDSFDSNDSLVRRRCVQEARSAGSLPHSLAGEQLAAGR